ncbi:hypothetical protein ACFT2C_04765 [Promicromonospora sp. NPDC057138]|uniref:hypothetical protein n=1 Tax=Promicromonospora sp. NPDC057138 TaxID=3346031 RepID=UPI003630BFE7
MNGRPVPVTLPRARFEVDPDGHLAVTVDDRPWQPPTQAGEVAPQRAGAVSLGRSDVRWARQQIANELNTPVLVEVVDGGHEYADIVDPDSYQHPDPSDRPGAGNPQNSGPGSEATTGGGAGRFAPGEPVVVTAIVGYAHADEHGLVHFQLPAALGTRTRNLLVHGQDSGTTIPFGQLPAAHPPTDIRVATQTSGGGAAPQSARRAFGQPSHDARRRPGPRPAPTPTRATSQAPESPDTGIGAL